MKFYITIFTDDTTRSSIFTRQNGIVVTTSIFWVHIHVRHTKIVEFTIDITIMAGDI